MAESEATQTETSHTPAAPEPEPVAPPKEAPPEEVAANAEVPPPADHERKPEEMEAVAARPADHKRKLEEMEVVENAAAAPPADHKRKLEEMEAAAEAVEEEKVAKEGEEPGVDQKEVEGEGEDAVEAEAKRPRVDGEGDGLGGTETEATELETSQAVNGELSVPDGLQTGSEVNVPEAAAELSQEDCAPLLEQKSAAEFTSETTSIKVEIPNNKVGVLIGRAGETIKFLQITSGAKIQITRDAEADPNSSSRPVELVGSPESINKAEQLIKEVIAEADAGGSPALIARGFGTVQSGAEQIEMQVPNDKVGLVIGKGGETIKNLQTRSGARIQLIPQHLPEGDLSKERTVRVTGSKKQIEAAKTMIMAAINQVPRSGSHMSGHGHQNYRPRGPGGAQQWGPRSQPIGGPDYQHRGMYPQNQQYLQQHGGYSQQPPPRSSMGAGWDQRSGAPVQAPPQGSGYDYYRQGGQSFDAHSSGGPGGASTPTNYNYGQPQAPGGYGQPTNYMQSAPAQQTYGQQYYSQQPVNPQQGYQSYPPQQDPYGKPAYSGVQQPYGPPRPMQPGDAMYQGQQQYQQGSTAPPQPGPGYAQPYGPPSGGTEGYMQPSAGYQQPGGQVAPGYGQGVQPGMAYPQPGMQAGGYVQYPTSQPGYTEQVVPNNVNYGYQGGPTDAAAYSNNQPAGGYAQAGYVQPPASQAGYEQQPVPPAQAAYAAPQTGYGGQWQA